MDDRSQLNVVGKARPAKEASHKRFIPGVIRRADLDLLAEPSSAKDSRIDPFDEVRRTDQKDFVLGREVADLNERLLDQLDVVLPERPIH